MRELIFLLGMNISEVLQTLPSNRVVLEAPAEVLPKAEHFGIV